MNPTRYIKLSFLGALIGGLTYLLPLLLGFSSSPPGVIIAALVNGAVFIPFALGLVFLVRMVVPLLAPYTLQMVIGFGVGGFVAGMFFYFGIGMYFSIIFFSIWNAGVLKTVLKQAKWIWLPVYGGVFGITSSLILGIGLSIILRAQESHKFFNGQIIISAVPILIIFGVFFFWTLGMLIGANRAVFKN